MKIQFQKPPKCKNCKVKDRRVIRHNYSESGEYIDTKFNLFCSVDCRKRTPTGDTAAFIGKPLHEILGCFNAFPMELVRVRSFVYVLFKDGYVVYFGSTTNLIERIRVHKKEGRKDFDTVMYFETDTYEALELYLIKTFPTKYNTCTTAKKAHEDDIYDDGLPF
jgi:predicted GIY-YIG superfamily endonuclease